MEYYEHKESVKIFVDLILKNSLIPIFGSGFTCGALAKGGKVPNAQKAVELMKAMIRSHFSESYEEDDFFKVSGVFVNKVPQQDRDDFFRAYFTDAKLDCIESQFLNLPWPHAYTINIDDGIENSSDFKPVLPYQGNYKRPRVDTKLLYKLHGDAEHELKYDSEHNIIFSSVQYLTAINLDANKSFLNNYKNDYIESNLVYIGCSLNDELDIKFVYNQVKEDCSNLSIRAVIRKQRLEFMDEVQLEEYGINTVFLVDDYRLFYEEVVNAYNEFRIASKIEEYRYRSPKVQRLSEKDLNSNLLIFSNGGLFNTDNNEFIRHNMMVTRNIIKEIESYLNYTNSIVVQGRRFCGKTSIICDIVEKLKKYDIYYFPSTDTQDEDTVRRLIEEKKGIVLIFDSNSIDHYAYQYLSVSEKRLKENNNRVLIFVNSSDNYLTDRLSAHYIRIPNVFRGKELKDFNKIADYNGLVKRTPFDTNLDYIKKLHDSKSIKEFPFLEGIPKQYSVEEMAFLILLAAVDKLYSKQIMNLGITNTKIDFLLKKLKGLVEKVENKRKGRGISSSRYKFVYNSRYCILYILSQFNTDSIVESIRYIVKHLRYTDDDRLYIEVVLFDTLNQLFGGKTGSSSVIFKIYESLSDILNDNMDYWLQRAKSIYRFGNRSSLSVDELKKAYRFAFKAYEDGRDMVNGILRSKAAMSLSLICCLLGDKTESEEKLEYEQKAIDYMFEALSSDYFRKRDKFVPIVEVEHRRGLKRLIGRICQSIIDNGGREMFHKAKYISEKLELLE